MLSKERMQLTPRRWFAWKAIAVNSVLGAPWNASPIFMTHVEPLKTGMGILAIECLSVMRPLCPKKVFATLHVKFRSRECIVGSWREEGHDTLVVLTDVSMEWIRQYCGPLLQARSPGSLVDHNTPTTAVEYLDTLFGAEESSILSQLDISEFVDKNDVVPSSIQRMTLKRRYIGFDAWSILRGFRPAAMEQKWCIRSEPHSRGEALGIYRSWTGFPVWKWCFTRGADFIDLSEVEIASHPEHYTPQLWPHEGWSMQAVVEDWLLGRSTLMQAMIEV